MAGKFQRILGAISFVTGLLHIWFWEFIRGIFYERIWHMLSPFVTPDAIAKYGVSLALGGVGAWLFWHTRPRPLAKPAIGAIAKSDNRVWRTSYKILDLADPKLVEAHTVERANLEKAMVELQKIIREQNSLSRQVDIKGLEAASHRHAAASTESNRARTASELLWSQMWADIHERLASGDLVAKGFPKPVEQNPDEVFIPAEYWRFLQLTNNYSNAEGAGKSYIGVAVAKR